MQQIDNNATVIVKLNKCTERYHIEQGIRQWDTISPKLLTTVLVGAFKKLISNNFGISIDDEYQSPLRFANDIVQPTDNLGNRKLILSEIKGETEKFV